MKLLRGKTTQKNIMKVEQLVTSNDNQAPRKPVCTINSIEWGAYRASFTWRDCY